MQLQKLWPILFAVGLLYFASAQATEGFHDDSEVGMVVTSGNTQADTFNFAQKNDYKWGENSLVFQGIFLETSSFGVQSARQYTLGLRFERAFNETIGFYLGQDLESDIFAGYAQRYNSDVGGKVVLLKDDSVVWNGEAGYRYTIENDVVGIQTNKSFLRFFTDVTKNFNKNVIGKISFEFLPNVSNFTDFRFNSEISLSALLNDVFSLKTGYVIKYINLPLPGVVDTTDTVFTTALVAKF